MSSIQLAPPSVRPLVKHEEPKRTAPIEELNRIKIRDIPNSKGKGAKERQEHDLAETKRVLVQLEVDTSFTDIVRPRKFDDKKIRTSFTKIRTRRNGDLSYLPQAN